MPVPMATESSEVAPEATQTPFPASTKQAASIIKGIHTDIMTVQFADKIIITVTQGGGLAQWIHVPLDTQNPNYADQHTQVDLDEGGLLPMSHLTATTVLGGTMPERETVGQLYATQLASAVATKNPEETRLVVVGLGLQKAAMDRDTFFEVVELALQCL
ncbi:MAG: hypothetical protein M4579_005369 [Chaenotheca gracillima]|nr:MAG: hypothetical protein M4579_005369 [Chaenotheca gracillima]